MCTECSDRPRLGVAAIAVAWGFVGLLVRWVDLPAVAIVTSRCALAAVTIGVVLAAQTAGPRPARTPTGEATDVTHRARRPRPRPGRPLDVPRGALSSGPRWAPCS